MRVIAAHAGRTGSCPGSFAAMKTAGTARRTLTGLLDPGKISEALSREPADLLRSQPLDLGNMILIGQGDDGNGNAAFAGPSGSANTMNVIFGMTGDIEIIDMAHVGD